MVIGALGLLHAGSWEVAEGAEIATSFGKKRKNVMLLNVSNRNHLPKQFAKTRLHTETRQPRKIPRIPPAAIPISMNLARSRYTTRRYSHHSLESDMH